MFFAKAIVIASMAASTLAVAVPGTHSGDGTFYETGLTACGVVNTDDQYIVAVSQYLYDSFPGYVGGNPNANPICGKSLTAHYEGRAVTVTVTDRCTGCAEFDLDFSMAAFQQLASLDVGRLQGVTWSFNN
ncbi:plant expansin [Cytidiella melzeri]|nr:plant expansin [Cytidiella melzeri]